MQIRNKLTLQFTALVAILLIVFSFSVYFATKHFQQKIFKTRLEEKALNTVTLLLEVDEINMELLKDLRKNYLLALPQEFVRIYDINNTRIYKDDTISIKLTDEQLKEIREKKETHFNIDDRQLVGIYYKNRYVIAASAIDVDGMEQLKYLRLALLAANLIGLVIILFTGRFFAIQSLKPISKIINDVGGISEKNLSQRVNEGNRQDEISQLAVTFNKMFDRIEDAFERQRRFVSNASHELRTPLTAITGEIEVTLMKERSKEDYVEVLQSALEEARMLTKLSNGLLQLAQAGEQKGSLLESINIYLLMERIKEETFRRFTDNKLQVTYSDELPLSHIEVMGNDELLKIALMNIIENGFKFSHNKPVFFRIELHDERLIFNVIDSGIGISNQDMNNVYQPFYRGENVSTIPGHGIGLSLSEKIIKLHDGIMEIHSQAGLGTRITINLPMKRV